MCPPSRGVSDDAPDLGCQFAVRIAEAFVASLGHSARSRFSQGGREDGRSARREVRVSSRETIREDCAAYVRCGAARKQRTSRNSRPPFCSLGISQALVTSYQQDSSPKRPPDVATRRYGGFCKEGCRLAAQRDGRAGVGALPREKSHLDRFFGYFSSCARAGS
jgi:hypothetical protein